MKTASFSSSRKLYSKRLFLLRHGQAQHNPRAEAARHEGCTHDRFLAIMKEDDALDAPLTALGLEQAKRVTHDLALASKLRSVDLIVSSPLSRALHTANLVIPPISEKEIIEDVHNDSNNPDNKRLEVNGGQHEPSRICINSFREINGWLLNAKRRNKSELENLFPSWDFGFISSETDNDWTETLESQADCGERGYKSLLWITKRVESTVFVATHGGLLRFLTVDHPNVKLADGRTSEYSDQNGGNEGGQRDVTERFENCEVREYVMSWEKEDKDEDGKLFRPIITLTEVN